MHPITNTYIHMYICDNIYTHIYVHSYVRVYIYNLKLYLNVKFRSVHIHLCL